MDFSNYTNSISGTTDPTKLESAYQNLLGAQGYALGNPQARPAGWFIAAGQDKNFKAPYVQPKDPSGGKWICTEMLKRGIITREDYRNLAKAHALAILRHPNFCFWYLKHANKLVKEMNRAGFHWRSEGKAFFQNLKEIYHEHGFETAFRFYKLFCTRIWLQFGEGLPHPDSVKLGFFKFLKEKWLWKNLLRTEMAKS